MPGRLPFLSLLLCACANVILFFEYAGIVKNVVVRGLCLQELGSIRYSFVLYRFQLLLNFIFA